ncbi:Hypothetical predicted protein [Pelobates cultripes]|uniref:Transposase n=1 Tax=Pelobates cultripes TaxID=61616 RepID=A0AAD1T9W0_PELCU|nr:Hypothetical predicted protein [Pelobates cultripes]
MDAVKTRNKDRRKDKQDGGDTPGLSDDQSDAESISSKLSDSMITERSLHRMLQDLRSTIRKDFLQIDSELRKEITTLGERTSHLENKSDELCVAHNEVVDKLQKLSEDNNMLQLKLADLEDRSRRQNVRFRGIPDDISHDALPAYILSICKILVPDLPDSAWTFDRMHRLPRPARRTLVITEPTEGMKIITSWGLWNATTTTSHAAQATDLSPKKLQADWNMTGSSTTKP